MTTELENQFFSTFGIEPKYKTCIFKYCKNKKEYDCENCNDNEWHYPQITDRILLELICLINKYSLLDLWGKDIKDLKLEILDHCITIALNGSLDEATQELKKYKQQIQRLFKEE